MAKEKFDRISKRHVNVGLLDTLTTVNYLTAAITYLHTGGKLSFQAPLR